MIAGFYKSLLNGLEERVDVTKGAGTVDIHLGGSGCLFAKLDTQVRLREE